MTFDNNFLIIITFLIRWNNHTLFKCVLTSCFLAAEGWRTQNPQKMFHSATSHQINMVPCQNTFPQAFVHDREYCARTWCERSDCAAALLRWRHNGSTRNDRGSSSCSFRKDLHPTEISSNQIMCKILHFLSPVIHSSHQTWQLNEKPAQEERPWTAERSSRCRV